MFFMKSVTEEFHEILINSKFFVEEYDTQLDKAFIAYKYMSRKYKQYLRVELMITSMSYLIQCLAIVRGVDNNKTENTVKLTFNWLTESPEIRVNRFKKDLVTKLIEIMSYGLTDLPNELIAIIVRRMTFRSVIQFSMTNKLYQGMCFNDKVWKLLFRQQFSPNTFRRYSN